MIQQFIGHYQNWFKPEHIEDFINYYKFCESVRAVGTRQENDDGNRLEKADTSTCFNHIQPAVPSKDDEIVGDDKFHNFLKYINGDILECYMKEYPGFDRPMAIDLKIQKTQLESNLNLDLKRIDLEILRNRIESRSDQIILILLSNKLPLMRL